MGKKIINDNCNDSIINDTQLLIFIIIIKQKILKFIDLISRRGPIIRENSRIEERMREW